MINSEAFYLTGAAAAGVGSAFLTTATGAASTAGAGSFLAYANSYFGVSFLVSVDWVSYFLGSSYFCLSSVTVKSNAEASISSFLFDLSAAFYSVPALSDSGFLSSFALPTSTFLSSFGVSIFGLSSFGNSSAAFSNGDYSDLDYDKSCGFSVDYALISKLSFFWYAILPLLSKALKFFSSYSPGFGLSFLSSSGDSVDSFLSSAGASVVDFLSSAGASVDAFLSSVVASVFVFLSSGGASTAGFLSSDAAYVESFDSDCGLDVSSLLSSDFSSGFGSVATSSSPPSISINFPLISYFDFYFD